MNEEMKKLLGELNTAFNSFKASNDERLKQIETRGSADAIVVASVEKANADITRVSNDLKTVQDALKEVETAQARVAPAGSPEAREKEILNATQFLSMTRKTRVENVTDDDLKAVRAFKNAQAHYLRNPAEAMANPDIRAALQTGSAPGGGIWLHPDTSGKIVEFVENLSGLRKFASAQSIGTDTFEGFYDLGEADSGWVGETQARSDTDTPELGDWKIPMHEQYASPKATQKTLDDAEFDVEGWLAKKVAQKLAKRESYGFALGNGIKQPKGFTTYAAGTPARTSVAAYRVIRRINSGAAGAFAAVDPADKFIDLVTAIPSDLRNGAAFAMNQLTLAEVRKIKDGEGRYVFIPDFAANPNGSILGHSIIELNDMADIGANSLSIAFGNWGEGYQIIDHRVGIRVLRDPYTDKPYVKFYTTKRVGGDVVNFQAIVLMKFAA